MTETSPASTRGDGHDPARDGLLLIVDPARRVRLLGRGIAPEPSDVDAASARVPARSLFAAWSRDAIDLAIQDTLDGREVRVEADAELAAGGGRLRVVAEPLRDSAGKVVAVCLSAGRREMEGDDAHGRLSEVARLQRREAIGQLALGIAHDFNNLLSGVGAAADSLASVAALQTDANAVEDVAAIRAACSRAGALVRQLLSFGGADERAPGLLDVDASIRDLAQLLERLWKHRAKLVLDLDAPGSMIEGDPTEFDQIILNLALNARDAMLDGGTLTIRTRRIARPPEGLAHSAGNRVAIELADTGIGITPDVLPRIFDPYFTTKRARGGTGLGLATVRGLIRRVGGTIEVESTVGTGTCFRLVFPDVAAVAVSSTIPASAQGQMAPVTKIVTGQGDAAFGDTVMLVDDDDLVRRLAERALAKSGWTVLAAASGEAAMELLAANSNPIRALVTDLSLPGMDGEEVMQAVRDHYGTPHLPVVIASGLRASPVAVWCAQGDPRGANVRFLSKPYLPSDLLDALQTVIVPASDN